MMQFDDMPPEVDSAIFTQEKLDAVTDDEIRIWLFAVPKMTEQTRQCFRDKYVINYRVREKIVRAKHTGQFQKIVNGLYWIIPISNSLQNFQLEKINL